MSHPWDDAETMTWHPTRLVSLLITPRLTLILTRTLTLTLTPRRQDPPSKFGPRLAARPPRTPCQPCGREERRRRAHVEDACGERGGAVGGLHGGRTPREVTMTICMRVCVRLHIWPSMYRVPAAGGALASLFLWVISGPAKTALRLVCASCQCMCIADGLI